MAIEPKQPINGSHIEGNTSVKFPTTNRIREWRTFAELVQDHLSNYAIPQYGDMPDDELSVWTSRDCIRQLSKYVQRYGNNARGPEEALRDLLKIAHYSCVAYAKLLEDIEEDHVDAFSE